MAKCAICKADDCPCPLCHGNPKQYLGGVHAGIPDHRTGAVNCVTCWKKTDRAEGK